MNSVAAFTLPRLAQGCCYLTRSLLPYIHPASRPQTVLVDMSLEASPAQRKFLEPHQRDIELLNRKLSIIPKRFFSSGEYPSITEFYDNADTLEVPSIPP